MLHGHTTDRTACILQYEDETLQAMALSCIPEDELQEKAQQQVHEAHARGESLAEQDALAKQLLEWFKHSFFTWVSAAPDKANVIIILTCMAPHSSLTQLLMMAAPRCSGVRMLVEHALHGELALHYFQWAALAEL